MVVGSARISAVNQLLTLQQDALPAVGCRCLGADTISVVTDTLPGLVEALVFWCAGGVLVIRCRHDCLVLGLTMEETQCVSW